VIWIALAVAIVGASVQTGDGEILPQATVVIDGGRIVAAGPRVEVPPGAQRIDGSGMVVTPGLIDAASRLGVVEISGVDSSVEGTLPSGSDPVRAALRVRDGFDALSQLIPVARAAGLTSAVVIPRGGLVAGQSIWVDLAGERLVRRDSLALHVELGADAEAAAGTRSAAFLRLRELWADARLYRGNRGPYISRRLRDLSVDAADLDVLERALEGQLPVVFHVDRRADILTALELARSQGLRAVLAGAAEAWLAADAIAAAGVPVILDPLANLPVSFDALHVREDAARLLHERGVPVAFSPLSAPHRAQLLRQAAGNAVARGYPREAALAAITRIPAQIFGQSDTGVIRAGAAANLVVWNGDPFELTSWPVHVFVRGRELDLITRQDRLTRRYLPAAGR
jgi:imidazolonepropionase-like amidohydrolase